MTNVDLVYLMHIRDALSKIKLYAKDHNQESFLADTMVQDAIIRQFEILGEATKNLSSEFRTKHSGLPWKQMAGMRDKLIHAYMGVDLLAVWLTVEKDLGPLRDYIDKLLKNPESLI